MQTNPNPIMDKYTIESGTSFDYICCNGVYFLKTVGDSIATTTKAREVCKMLNEYDALVAVAEAAQNQSETQPEHTTSGFRLALSKLSEIRKANQ